MKKLYFKVYQNKDCTNNSYFVEEPEKILSMYGLETFYGWEECRDNDELPVFEPVFMTEKEFLSLPDFEGF